MDNLLNVVLLVLNVFFAGRWEATVSARSPTAAQTRVLQSLTERLRVFIRGAPGTSGDDAIHRFLQQSPGYEAWDRGAALPLGVRAGVPERAATVDLAAVVATSAPEISEQLLEPSTLLLPPRLRPEAPKPYVLLAASYPAHVRNCVKTSMQRLLPRRKIYKVRHAP